MDVYGDLRLGKSGALLRVQGCKLRGLIALVCCLVSAATWRRWRGAGCPV